MADETSPQLIRQELGARLRELRRSRGMTVEQVAGRLLCSPSKISRMETGQRGASQRDVRDLVEIYQVEEVGTREELMALAKGARQRGGEWRQAPGGGDPEYNGLETTASSITVYVSSLIPALFQTEAYARFQLRGRDPDLDEEWIDQRVHSYAQRQRMLTRANPPEVVALIDEAALHRRVGGPEIMRAQLDRLQRVSALPNVEVLIVPFEAGSHPGVESAFSFMEFDSSRVPAIAYSENLIGMGGEKRKEIIQRYRVLIAYLKRSALDADASSRVIAELRDSYIV